MFGLSASLWLRITGFIGFWIIPLHCSNRLWGQCKWHQQYQSKSIHSEFLSVQLPHPCHPGLLQTFDTTCFTPITQQTDHLKQFNWLYLPNIREMVRLRSRSALLSCPFSNWTTAIEPVYVTHLCCQHIQMFRNLFSSRVCLERKISS